MRSFNLADLFEVAATARPDREAVVAGEVRLTYAELDDRASRFAAHLTGVGVEPGDHVAVLAWNRSEWLEVMLGSFKARAVPVNINYRYTADELVHVLADADAVALVAEATFIATVEGIRDRLPTLRDIVVIDGDSAPGTVGYEDALTTDPLPTIERSGDDRYVLYTGGTTGSPKGVVWRSEDLFFAALAGGNPGGDPIATPDELADHMVPEWSPWMVTSPLMHGNGQWNSLVPLLTGRGVVLWTGHHFDAAGVARVAATEKAQLLVLIGDGMALPFVEHLESLARSDGAPGGCAADAAAGLGSLRLISSGGAILSGHLKERLARLLPSVTVLDGFGASETGSNGRLVGTGEGSTRPRFAMGPHTTVLDDDLRPVAVGETGLLARRGHVPLGYWKDSDKTAATFPTDPDGVRWAIPGDLARPEADGTITLLGRGSACINTGGEKVYPDEVAVAVKSHPDVADAIVVGAPDERFGQRVVAVIAPRPGSEPALDDVRDHLRGRLAGYKAPRQLVSVEALQYTPQGKPDLRWAAEVAAASHPKL